jgi:hypothetical protein
VRLAAVGITAGGEKHAQGLRESATENVAACKTLLADLIEQGLHRARGAASRQGGQGAAPGDHLHLR